MQDAVSGVLMCGVQGLVSIRSCLQAYQVILLVTTAPQLAMVLDRVWDLEWLMRQPLYLPDW